MARPRPAQGQRARLDPCRNTAEEQRNYRDLQGLSRKSRNRDLHPSVIFAFSDDTARGIKSERDLDQPLTVARITDEELLNDGDDAARTVRRPERSSSSILARRTDPITASSLLPPAGLAGRSVGSTGGTEFNRITDRTHAHKLQVSGTSRVPVPSLGCTTTTSPVSKRCGQIF